MIKRLSFPIKFSKTHSYAAKKTPGTKTKKRPKTIENDHFRWTWTLPLVDLDQWVIAKIKQILSKTIIFKASHILKYS